MIEPIHLSTLITLGFLLGFRHAFEPDHLAAVSTLATRPGGWRGAAWLGTAWGVGHTLSVGAALLLLVLLDIRLPELFNRVAEFGVAVLLIVLGIATIRSGTHQEAEDDAPERSAQQSFGFGLIHGLAGSGTLVVLLAATAASDAEKLAYFLPFGVGTVGGMLAVSLLTFALTDLAGRRQRDWRPKLQQLAATLSILIGCWLGIETLGLV